MTNESTTHEATLQRTGQASPLAQEHTFWLVAYTLFIVLLGSTLPTSLYVVYQGRWHFSASVLTAIFATYPVGVVVTLLFFGRLSDQIGRRRVLVAAVVLSIVSSIIFIFAQGVAWLFVARAISGCSIGLCTGTATAALAELQPQRDTRRAALVSTASSMVGLGVGPLLAGLLAQYVFGPTLLVFLVHLVLLIPALLGMWGMPEKEHNTSSQALLHPQRLSVPAGIRSSFLLASVTAFCAFAVLGLFAALVPSFVISLLHVRNLAVGGTVVFLLFSTSAIAQLLLRQIPNRPSMGIGLILLTSGLILIVVAFPTQSLPMFLGGTLCAGLGQGLAYMGSLAFVNRVAPADHRGEVDSSYFVIGYAAVAMPALGVGVASEYLGFYVATSAFVVCISVLAVGTALNIVWTTLHTTSSINV